jgi:hypothetical protein
MESLPEGDASRLKISKEEEFENDYTWLLDILVHYIKSPAWTTELCNFIDDNCIEFAGELGDENNLKFTDLHNRFKKIVDLKLDEFLVEYGVTTEMVMGAMAQIQTKEQLRILNQLIASDNFLLFKKMMIHRNNVLNMLAMQELQAEFNEDDFREAEFDQEEADLMRAIEESKAMMELMAVPDIETPQK